VQELDGTDTYYVNIKLMFACAYTCCILVSSMYGFVLMTAVGAVCMSRCS